MKNKSLREALGVSFLSVHTPLLFGIVGSTYAAAMSKKMKTLGVPVYPVSRFWGSGMFVLCLFVYIQGYRTSGEWEMLRVKSLTCLLVVVTCQY